MSGCVYLIQNMNNGVSLAHLGHIQRFIYSEK